MLHEVYKSTFIPALKNGDFLLSKLKIRGKEDPFCSEIVSANGHNLAECGRFLKRANSLLFVALKGKVHYTKNEASEKKP